MARCGLAERDSLLDISPGTSSVGSVKEVIGMDWLGEDFRIAAAADVVVNSDDLVVVIG